MIKPIYFPFTYVPQSVTRALAACFESFIVYQPWGKMVPDEMQSWIETHVMEARVPDQTDDQVIEKVVKDFRSFANLHSESKNLKTAAVWGQHGAIPFFSEASTSRIIADLKKGGSPDSAEPASDPLFGAMVFLGFAQDFDRQGDELNRGLGVHEQQSFEMLKMLKGETEIDPAAMAPDTASKINDPGDYMGMARLQAWALLFLKDPVGSGLFMTSSKSVFDQVMTKVPAPEKIVQSARLPADEIKVEAFNTWRDSFLKHLNRLVEIPRPDSVGIGFDPYLDSASDTMVKLTLYLVPGQIPREFFAQFLEARQPAERLSDQKAKFKNTLVGLVECQ